MLFIAANNGLGLMDVEIVNAFFTLSCTEIFFADVVHILVLDVVQ